MDSKDSKRGFSGLVDLVSDISDTDEFPCSKKSSPSSKPSQYVPTKSERKEPGPNASSSVAPIENIGNGDIGGGARGKWILGIIAIIFVIWLFSNGEQNNKKMSYNPPQPSKIVNSTQNNPAPIVLSNTNQKTGLQYEKPPVGTNNKLFVPQICWCLRESIRIETMRDLVDSNYGVDVFNKIVDDYNCRCGSYQYRSGSLESAQRQVEAYRSQIISEAIRDAEILGLTFNRKETSKVSRRPSTKITRQAQELLIELGYDPGPIDGQYGRRTADAVKAFQRDAGITQDGWIDEDLLYSLHKVVKQ